MSRLLVILCLIGLAVCLVLKLIGHVISDLFFAGISVLLILAGVAYKSYDQAAKEEEDIN